MRHLSPQNLQEQCCPLFKAHDLVQVVHGRVCASLQLGSTTFHGVCPKEAPLQMGAGGSPQ